MAIQDNAKSQEERRAELEFNIEQLITNSGLESKDIKEILNRLSNKQEARPVVSIRKPEIQQQSVTQDTTATPEQQTALLSRIDVQNLDIQYAELRKAMSTLEMSSEVINDINRARGNQELLERALNKSPQAFEATDKLQEAYNKAKAFIDKYQQQIRQKGSGGVANETSIRSTVASNPASGSEIRYQQGYSGEVSREDAIFAMDNAMNLKNLYDSFRTRLSPQQYGNQENYFDTFPISFLVMHATKVQRNWPTGSENPQNYTPQYCIQELKKLQSFLGNRGIHI